MPDAGIITVAQGAAAHKLAGDLAASIQKLDLPYPLAVITDSKPEEPVPGVTYVVDRVTEGCPGRELKVRSDLLSPFKYTLYLDADTRVHQSPAVFFDALDDGFDLVITPSVSQGESWGWHLVPEEREKTIEELGVIPFQYQAGVFAFRRRNRTRSFFAAWREEWWRWQDKDQAAFVRALYSKPLKIWMLGSPWNGGAAIEHRWGALRRVDV